MYLHEFSRPVQKVFLNMAYTLLWADRKCTEAEKSAFQSYGYEVQVDVNQVQKIDFKEEVQKLTKLTSPEKKKFFFELMTMAMSDFDYADEERELLLIVSDAFNLSKTDIQNMKQLIQDLLNDIQKINVFVNA